MSIFKRKPRPRNITTPRAVAMPQALGTKDVLDQIQEAADSLASTRAKLLALVEGQRNP